MHLFKTLSEAQLTPYLRRWASALMVIIGICLTASHPAHAERRALLIGNANYSHIPKLNAPLKDVKDMAVALQNAGFAKSAIAQHTDLDRRAMQKTIREFKDTVQAGDEVLIYYTGHGVQSGGNNYLLPTDAPELRHISSQDVIVDNTIRLQRFLSDMTERQARFTLLIADACRDNPIQYAKSAGAGAGLAPESPSNGQMIVFATGSGQLAGDSANKQTNSLFTQVLLEQLKTPGTEVRELFKTVKEQVHARALSNGKNQLPAIYDQAVGDFYLGSARGRAKPPAPAESVASMSQLQQKNTQLELELAEYKKATLAIGAQAIKDAYAKANVFEPPPKTPSIFLDGYYLHSSGIVSSVATKLTWMRCSLGQSWSASANSCTGDAKTYTYEQAQQAARDLNAKGGFGGYTDWRVPTVRELHSLVVCNSGKTKASSDPEDGGAAIKNYCDGNYTRPTINTAIFPKTPETLYWTSSPYVGNSYYAWFVNFGDGYVSSYGRDVNYHVRLVRASQ